MCLFDEMTNTSMKHGSSTTARFVYVCKCVCVSHRNLMCGKLFCTSNTFQPHYSLEYGQIDVQVKNMTATYNKNVTIGCLHLKVQPNLDYDRPNIEYVQDGASCGRFKVRGGKRLVLSKILF